MPATPRHYRRHLAMFCLLFYAGGVMPAKDYKAPPFVVLFCRHNKHHKTNARFTPCFTHAAARHTMPARATAFKRAAANSVIMSRSRRFIRRACRALRTSYVRGYGHAWRRTPLLLLRAFMPADSAAVVWSAARAVARQFIAKRCSGEKKA